MTPDEVAADSSRRLRFQNEVAYLDRMRPTDSEAGADTQLFGSKEGVLIIAWLWPSLSYEPGFDPLEAVAEDNYLLSEYAARQSQELSPAEALEAVSVALDLRRRSQLGVAATRFRQIIGSTARAVDRSEEDLMTHLRWSVPLSQLELARLLVTHTPFPFQVIVRLCKALQLEFTDAWVLVDPQRLSTSIDQSVLASRISDHLRSLTIDDLESVERRLPRRLANAEQAEEPDSYLAPRPGGRYWSLYEALASEPRDSPDYTLAELDGILVDTGEPPLPDSSRKDRSWWAGNGTKTEGHPQLSSWWAAGYRIRNLAIDPSSDRVASVGFEALPGRAEWLADPGRIAQREYRVPGPEKIEIYRNDHDSELSGLDPIFLAAWLTAIAPDLASMASAASNSITATFESMGLAMRQSVPEDPDIRHLVEFLNEIGEADRSEIERHFSQARETSVDPAWMTNLLTRARRQGWSVNNGTRSRPRWASTTMTTELMLDIAENLKLETPTSEPRDALPLVSLLQIDDAIPVAQIAREIIESQGGTWQPEFESTDKRLTELGVKALQDATGMHFAFDETDALDGNDARHAGHAGESRMIVTGATPVTTAATTGTIHSLRQGFGFIEPDAAPHPLFFSDSDVVNKDFSDLAVGDAVTFTVDDSGLRARHITSD